MVELLRERLYGAISCLATLAVLTRYTDDDTAAWTRVLDVTVAAGGLWAASLLAHWVAHLAVYGRGPRGKEALTIVRSSAQILVAAVVPVLLLMAAGFGWLSVATAKWTALWFLVAEMGLIVFLAVRRAQLRWWQQAIAVGSLASLGALVVIIKTLAH